MKTNKGSVILVTGATRGIGGAIARRLLEEGAGVIAHYNKSEGTRDELVKAFGEDHVLPVKTDLADAAGADRLWDEALAWKGKIDGVVNNAAVMLSTLPEADMKDWRRDWETTLQVNTRATADICRHAILHFREAKGGAIVNIASRAGFRGDLPDSMHYAASKGAVVAFTRSIAKGYAKDKIYAYTIAPGWVATERVMPKLTAKGNEFMLAEVPTGEAAPPEEVANIAAFLLAGNAEHATGATFDINGASYFH